MMTGLQSIATKLKTYDLAPVSVGKVSNSTRETKQNTRAFESNNEGQGKVKVDQSSEKGPQGLSREELKQLEKLKKRDRVVRAHEQAHIAAGGPYVRGGPRYVYQRGPDGRLYAIGGEVSIDVSPVPNDPKATIRKMQVVKRAALAPAQPSPQDYHIAAQAAMEMQKAQAELNKMKAQAAYVNSSGTFAGSSFTLSIVA